MTITRLEAVEVMRPEDREKRWRSSEFQIGEAIDDLVQISRDLELPTCGTAFRKLEQALLNNVFTLGVVGRFKNGKSSLINALLAASDYQAGALLHSLDLLPVSRLPTKAICIKLVYSPSLRVDVLHRDGTTKGVELDHFHRRARVQGGDAEWLESIDEFVVGCPSQLLRADATIVETMGDYEHTEKTIQALDRLDAAIIVYNTHAIAGMGELEFARIVSERVGKTFTVVNLVDEHSLDEELVTAVAERLGHPDQTGRPLDLIEQDVFIVNVKAALDGFRTGDNHRIHYSGILEFEKRLSDFLLHEKDETRTAKIIRQIDEEAANLERHTTRLATEGKLRDLHADVGRRITQCRSQILDLLKRPEDREVQAISSETLQQALGGARSKLKAILEHVPPAELHETDLDAARRADRHLQLAEAEIRRGEKVVVVGGHFSSGKSTLINRLFEREVLPSSILPETGVSCWLRAGDVDQGFVLDEAGRELSRIGLTAAEIAAWTSLRKEDGMRRKEVSGAHRVDITVRESWLLHDMVIVDSPGINDTQEMEEIAFEIACKGDLLIWVVNSRQALSMTEIAFIERFVARKGSRVLFAINAFLQTNWATFLAEDAPVHKERILDAIPSMGLDESQPLIFPICARPPASPTASQAPSESDLGLAEALKTLLAASRQIPADRYARIMAECNEARHLLSEHMKEVENRQRVLVTMTSTFMAEYQIFMADKDRIIAESASEHYDYMKGEYERLLWTVSPRSIKRDNSYHIQIAEIHDTGIERLIEDVMTYADDLKQNGSFRYLAESVTSMYLIGFCNDFRTKASELSLNINIPDYPLDRTDVGFLELIFDERGAREKMYAAALNRDYNELQTSLLDNTNKALDYYSFAVDDIINEFDQDRFFQFALAEFLCDKMPVKQPMALFRDALESTDKIVGR